MLSDSMLALLVVLLVFCMHVICAADHYSVLGVDRASSASQIRQAYRRLALQYHPDKNVNNPDAEQLFIQITQAYEVLSDMQSRRNYDRTLDGAKHFSAGTRHQQTNVNLDEAFKEFESLFTTDLPTTHRNVNVAAGSHFEATSPDDILESLFREFGGQPKTLKSRTSAGSRCRQSLKLVNGFVFADNICH